MKSLKGTQTEKNILTAFAGESQARNRYDFFAGAAKKDGYALVSEGQELQLNRMTYYTVRYLLYQRQE